MEREWPCYLGQVSDLYLSDYYGEVKADIIKAARCFTQLQMIMMESVKETESCRLGRSHSIILLRNHAVKRSLEGFECRCCIAPPGNIYTRMPNAGLFSRTRNPLIYSFILALRNSSAEHCNPCTAASKRAPECTDYQHFEGQSFTQA